MNKFTNLILAFALFAVSGVASAIPTGNVVFFGGLTPDTSSVTDADVFTFGNVLAVAASGDFSPMTGNSVTWSNLDTTQPFVAVSPLWTLDLAGTIYSFDLNNISFDSRFDGPLVGSRTINGTGEMSISGLGTTFGDFLFSTQDISVGGTFSFSAANAPEPAITLLLATGLIGFGFARKMRKA